MLHLNGAIIRFDDVVVIFKDLGIGFDGVYHGLSFKLVNRPLLLALVEFLGSKGDDAFFAFDSSC